MRLRKFIINIPNLPTMIAFRIIRRSLRNDPAYAEGWQSNLAMSIYDESHASLSGEFCNRAAARFMKLCFGVSTR